MINESDIPEVVLRTVARVRSARSYDARARSTATALHTGVDTPTQQHLRDDADINVLMRRFGVTGQAPVSVSREAFYGDFTGITDLASAEAFVARAHDQFMALPPELREEFGNSPLEFAAFVENASDEEIEALRPRAPATAPGGASAGDVVVPVSDVGGVPGGAPVTS